MPSHLSSLRLIFAGSGAFGAPTLMRLIERETNVVQVFTQPDKPAGRGHALTPTPIGKLALERGLNLIRTADINREALPDADLLLVIAFGQKLAPQVVDHARLGSINLHASRLPSYRGAAPINWAVINGDAVTGNSVIRLAQTMDAGAVLAMSETPIGPRDTAGIIHDRLAAQGADLVEQVTHDLMNGTAREIPQDHARASKAPKLSRASSVIDWTRDAESIARQIRGMSPWPGCRVELCAADGSSLDRLTLMCATAEKENTSARPGMISTSGLVGCGSGSLQIIDLHPDSKRATDWERYRNGKRLTGGETLRSIT
ncbi:MAG: methionyl-tRNA formyltransferase [Tepidisphaeraceae bacterium]